MKHAILKLVTDLDFVSFVNLCDRIEGFKGEWVMDLELFEGRGRVVLWGGVSKEGAAALNALLKAEKIHWESANPLVYIIDGMVPRLPILKRKPPVGGYKKDHWVPVTFRPGPPPRHGAGQKGTT